MPSQRLRLLPYLALATSVLALSLSPFFVRWSEAPGPVFSFYRTGLATLILFPVFLYSLRKSPWRGSFQALRYPFLGGIGTSLDLIFWTTAVHFTPIANATLLGNVAPLWVALFAWLVLKEKLRRIFWTGLCLTLVGAAVVLGSDLIRHPTLGLGDLMCLASSLFYAVYFLAAQKGRQQLSALRFIWVMIFVSTLGLLAFNLVVGNPLTGYPLKTFIAFLLSAVINQLIGYFGVIYALGHLPASIVSPTLIGQPVLAALIAIPLENEPLEPNQWLGGLAVLAGIYILHRSQEKKPATQAAVTEPASPAVIQP